MQGAASGKPADSKTRGRQRPPGGTCPGWRGKEAPSAGRNRSRSRPRAFVLVGPTAFGEHSLPAVRLSQWGVSVASVRSFGEKRGPGGINTAIQPNADGSARVSEMPRTKRAKVKSMLRRAEPHSSEGAHPSEGQEPNRRALQGHEEHEPSQRPDAGHVGNVAGPKLALGDLPVTRQAKPACRLSPRALARTAHLITDENNRYSVR